MTNKNSSDDSQIDTFISDLVVTIVLFGQTGTRFEKKRAETVQAIKAEIVRGQIEILKHVMARHGEIEAKGGISVPLLIVADGIAQLNDQLNELNLTLPQSTAPPEPPTNTAEKNSKERN